ncbi:MAG: tetratricopeptide repeat protein, partial [Bacteroidales bacterium]|nr:tetratricopeptide repeat protein [Bacteroidales bacterium]
AIAGKGNYIHASNTHVAFNELYKELEKIEKSDIEDVVYSKYISKFYIPLWIAFVLLIVEIIIYDKKILRMSQFSWLNKRINLVLLLMLSFLFSSHAQTREELKYLRQGNSHYYLGQKLDKKATELKHKKGELQQSESAQTKQQAQDLYEKASTSYLKSNQSNSDYYKSNFNLGNSLYKQGKYEDAATLFDKVINTPSINKNVKSKAYHNLGNSLLQQKKYKESIDAYKESLKLNASDMQTKYNLEYAKRMLAAQQQQQQQQQKQDKNQQQKDKDQQQNDDQQQGKDENQQQTDKKNNQQPQQKKDSERQLDALQQNERRTLEKVRNAEMKKMKKIPQEKDW